MISTTDIHWLAGLIEGEGCFILSKKKDRLHTYPAIQLDMQDLDVVERAASVMGGPSISTVNHKHARAASYRFRVSGYRAVGWMMTLYSLLGTRRRSRIKEVIEAWKASPSRASRLYRRDIQHE